jgi:hypothetical protein
MEIRRPSVSADLRVSFAASFAERRIAYAKLGKHVRIDSADLDAFVAAGRVEPRPTGPLQNVGGLPVPQIRRLAARVRAQP